MDLREFLSNFAYLMCLIQTEETRFCEDRVKRQLPRALEVDCVDIE